MTARERERHHRRQERQILRSVRGYLRYGNYVEAIRQLAWVLQQATAADAAAHVVNDEKIAKIQKLQRSPTKRTT